MTSILGGLVNDYASAYQANVGAFRTSSQINSLCAIATRISGICDAVDSGKTSAADAVTQISGALMIGRQIAVKLSDEDAVWVSGQAAIDQPQWRQKTASQEQRDQKLLSDLAGIAAQLTPSNSGDAGYDQLADGFEQALSEDAQFA
ncbi:hypothetical protein [Thalassospira sp.]|uniref:hypothetical protein n=1 Tax=Thalassospira sp. TaxID=1912094 RepID=UPI0027324A5B|nr:hypothetical protein [Thalassospira sp.]MDP2700019.1 hypothetical protein [Thalassospira sp.]